MKITERIIKASQELAQAKGFNNMKMDELAQQAGVSKRTIYRYFRSKEEVIEASLDTFMAEMDRQIENIMAQDLTASDVIKAVINNLIIYGQFIMNPMGLNDLRTYYPHLWKKIDAFRLERIRMVITKFIKQSHNALLHETDPRIVTAVILASIQAVVNPDFILENNLTFEETANQLSKLMMAFFYL
ncbi:MAG: TetR/AcrR family transcriptional regulator [Syntrophomonadaceae bacterium]|jgi:AcrR family transcriptional regulator